MKKRLPKEERPPEWKELFEIETTPKPREVLILTGNEEQDGKPKQPSHDYMQFNLPHHAPRFGGK